MPCILNTRMPIDDACASLIQRLRFRAISIVPNTHFSTECVTSGTMSIPITVLLNVGQPQEFKVHLASYNGQEKPLDVFVRDHAEWDRWNSWRSTKDDFNRKFILSLIEFYPDPGTWLFGGIYEVIARGSESRAQSYSIQSVPDERGLVGRLKVRFPRPGRVRAVCLENYLDSISVSELLRERYNGEPFPGYDSVTLEFPELETICRNNRQDWKNALQHMKGVYVVADKASGKKYVGSAYGDAGIWSRWSCYARTGHGTSDELTELIGDRGVEYARKNFRISLLEHRPPRTDDQVIIDRESYWKEALLTRTAFGYNKN